MDDNKALAALTQALVQIQEELRQMNRTLSLIAGQAKGSSGEPERRSPAGPRSTGYAGRKSAKPTGFKRAEARSEDVETAGDQGFRYPKKKSPSRPGKPLAKKGGGYPKKPR